MDACKYLQKRLQECSKYELTSNDTEFLEKFGLGEFIYKKVTWSKFRKWSINEELKDDIKRIIFESINHGNPIKFVYPFGGYKLWRFPVAPEVDWAEFFAIEYYIRYASPILQVYEPGVEFYFSSDDALIEKMNNIPHSDTDNYLASFKVLLGCFRKHFPKNMRLDIKQITDLYKKEEFEDELKENLKKATYEQLDLDQERKAQWLKRSELNIKWDGAQDWTKLSKEEKTKKIALGSVYVDACCNLSKRHAFVRGKDKIVISSTPEKKTIALGTTKNSVVKFWTGIGVLEEKAGSFANRILSPQQWEKAKNKKYELIKTNLIPLNNFKEIKVYNNDFDFSLNKH